MLKLQYVGHLMLEGDTAWREDWRQKEKGMTEDEMVGWHHQLNGHEFEQTLKTVKDREAWRAAVRGSQRVGHSLVTEQQQNPSQCYSNIIPTEGHQAPTKLKYLIILSS